MTRININPFNLDLSNLANRGNNFRKQLKVDNLLNTGLKILGGKTLIDGTLNSGRTKMHEQLNLRSESNKAFRNGEIGMTQHLNELACSGASTEYIEQSLRESNRGYKNRELSDPNTNIKITETGGNWFGKSREIKLEISQSRKSKKNRIDNTLEVNYKETNLNQLYRFRLIMLLLCRTNRKFVRQRRQEPRSKINNIHQLATKLIKSFLNSTNLALLK